MTHEMTREDADTLGYDTDGLPVLVAGETPATDVVNVWGQLPDADSITVGDADEFAHVGDDGPGDDLVAELTAAVADEVADGEYGDPNEVSDA